MSWQPPKRPIWVERLIEHGNAVSGPRNLVSLDSNELLDVAQASTGLGDFGDGDWRKHYEVLMLSLEEESDLHVMGRTMVRTEIIQTLRRVGKTSPIFATSDKDQYDNQALNGAFLPFRARKTQLILPIRAVATCCGGWKR